MPLAESGRIKVLVLSTSQLLAAIASLAITMVAVRLLSTDEYATYRQTMLIYQIAEPFLIMSLPMSLFYFFGRHDRPKLQTAYECYLLLLGSGILFSGIIVLTGDFIAGYYDNPVLRRTLLWLGPISIFSLPCSILSTVMVNQGRTLIYGLYNVFSRIVLAVISIVSCYGLKSAEGLFISQFTWSVLAFPISSLLIFSSFQGRVRAPDLRYIHTMVKYSLPLGFSAILSSTMIWMDKFIVSSLSSARDFAIYANGAMELPLIGIITGSIATVTLSDLTRHCQNGDYGIALQLFRKSAIVSALLLFPCMTFFLFFGIDYITIIFSDTYRESVIPFSIYLLILPYRIIYYGGAMMALGQAKLVFYRSIGDLLVNAVMCLALVHALGPVGAAISTVATLYLWSIPFNLTCLSRGFGCKKRDLIPFGPLLRILGAATICAFAAFIIKIVFELKSVGGLLLGGSVFVVLYSLLTRRYVSEARELAAMFPRARAVR